MKGASPGDFLRAGRSGDLRRRIYQNHLMGKQQGNLRSQLVGHSVCSDLEEAKQWIREYCVVQLLAVKSETALIWAEHFMLSVLRPRYSD